MPAACLQSCLAPAATTSSALGGGSGRHSAKRNCATQMPVRPYHVTWGPDIQIHDELPVSTPPPPPVELSIEGIRRNVHTQTLKQQQQQMQLQQAVHHAHPGPPGHPGQPGQSPQGVQVVQAAQVSTGSPETRGQTQSGHKESSV